MPDPWPGFEETQPTTWPGFQETKPQPVDSAQPDQPTTQDQPGFISRLNEGARSILEPMYESLLSGLISGKAGLEQRAVESAKVMGMLRPDLYGENQPIVQAMEQVPAQTEAQAQEHAQKGVPGVTGEVLRGVGKAPADVAGMAPIVAAGPLGIPVMALDQLGSSIAATGKRTLGDLTAEDWLKVGKQAGLGAAQIAVLHATTKLPIYAKVPINAATFAGPAAAQGAPVSDVVSSGIVGAALTPRSPVTKPREIPVTKPGELAPVKAGELPPEVGRVLESPRAGLPAESASGEFIPTLAEPKAAEPSPAEPKGPESPAAGSVPAPGLQEGAPSGTEGAKAPSLQERFLAEPSNEPVKTPGGDTRGVLLGPSARNQLTDERKTFYRVISNPPELAALDQPSSVMGSFDHAENGRRAWGTVSAEEAHRLGIVKANQYGIGVIAQQPSEYLPSGKSWELGNGAREWLGLPDGTRWNRRSIAGVYVKLDSNQPPTYITDWRQANDAIQAYLAERGVSSGSRATEVAPGSLPQSVEQPRTTDRGGEPSLRGQVEPDSVPPEIPLARPARAGVVRPENGVDPEAAPLLRTELADAETSTVADRFLRSKGQSDPDYQYQLENIAHEKDATAAERQAAEEALSGINRAKKVTNWPEWARPLIERGYTRTELDTVLQKVGDGKPLTQKQAQTWQEIAWNVAAVDLRHSLLDLMRAKTPEARKLLLDVEAHLQKGGSDLSGMSQRILDYLDTEAGAYKRITASHDPEDITIEEATRFRREGKPPQEPTVTPEQAQEALLPLTKNLKEGPAVKVVRADELPPKLRAAIRDRRTRTLDKTVTGLYDPETRTAYILWDHLKNPEEGLKTGLHEVVGHHGLETLLGNRSVPLFNDLWRQRKADIEKIAGEYKLDMGIIPDRHRAASELLARMAEDPKASDMGILKRVYANLRLVLRKFAPNMKWTDDDLRHLLTASRRNLEGKTPGIWRLQDVMPTATEKPNLEMRKTPEGPGLFGEAPDEKQKKGYLPTDHAPWGTEPTLFGEVPKGPPEAEPKRPAAAPRDRGLFGGEMFNTETEPLLRRREPKPGELADDLKKGPITRNRVYDFAYTVARAGKSPVELLGKTEAGREFVDRTERTWHGWLTLSNDRRFPVEQAMQRLKRSEVSWARKNFLQNFEEGRPMPTEGLRKLAEAWTHANTLLGNEARKYKIEVRTSDGGTKLFEPREATTYVPHVLTEEARTALANGRGPIFDAIFGPMKAKAALEETAAILAAMSPTEAPQNLKLTIEKLIAQDPTGPLAKSGVAKWLKEQGGTVTKASLGDYLVKAWTDSPRVQDTPLWGLINQPYATKRHGNLEYQRDLRLPFYVDGKDGKRIQVLETDPAKVLLGHIDKATRRIAIAKVFGPKSATRSVEELVNHMVAQGVDRSLAERTVPSVWKRLQGADQGWETWLWNHHLESAYNALNSYTAAANLSMAWIQNLFGGHVPESIRQGIFPTAKAFLQSFTTRIGSEKGQELKRRGAVVDNILQAYAATEGIEGISGKLARMVLKGTGFNYANAHINMALAFHWATELPSMAEAIRANKPAGWWREAFGPGWTKDRATRYLSQELKFSEKDIARMVAEGPNEADIRRSIQKEQELVNAMHESPIERPAAINLPLFNVIFRYSSYVRKFADTMHYAVKEAERGHFLPLARAMVVIPVSGEVVAAVRNWFLDRKREDKGIGTRLMNDAMEAGTFGMWGQLQYWWENRARHGSSFMDLVLKPPVLDTLTSLVNGITESAAQSYQTKTIELNPLWQGLKQDAGLLRAGERMVQYGASKAGMKYGRESLARRLYWMLYRTDGTRKDGTTYRALDPHDANKNTAKMLVDRYYKMGLNGRDLLRDFEEITQEREARRGTR